METLKTKHLAPYLEHKLKVKQRPFSSIEELKIIDTFRNQCSIYNKVLTNEIPIEDIIPILRPISDLKKEIEVNGENFIPIDGMFLPMGERNILNSWADENRCWLGNQISYLIYQNLFELHFDIFGLIPKGLAIDINTLK